MTITTDSRTDENGTPSGRLVTHDGRSLPLVKMRLVAEAGGGLAACRLEQTFANKYDEALSVTYQLPLPADGAVSAFAFQIGERRITGEIDERRAARERFEEALVDGRTAALLEQDRSSLFTQEIGNIPPGAEIVAEVSIDQPLAWLDEGSWEWRFPTTVAPRYLGAEGRVEDAKRVQVDVAERSISPRLELALSIRDGLAGAGEPTSPSHPLAARRVDQGHEVVFRAEEGAALDRDVVVRWPVAQPEVGCSLIAARPSTRAEHGDAAYGLLTLVPPAAAGAGQVVGRDVIALIDTSGSMHGEPLAQARQVISRIVETLGERDRLELVEFSNRPRRWKRGAVRMTEGKRRDALRWIGSLSAGGGTEMREAIVEALRPLGGESQRQVILVTDGLIGFEQEIVSEILERLPASSRVHTIGVGSAVNRTLTGGAARAGRGVEVILGLGEDPAPSAERIARRTDAPLVVDLELSGSALLKSAPERLPDLFAGAPARVGVKLRSEGGELLVRGRTEDGTWERRLEIEPTAADQGRREIVNHFGRETVQDLEMRLAAGAPAGEVNARIEQVGLCFQLATRLTSWIAVSEEADVDPTAPSRRERVPHELPHGLSIEGLGLRYGGSFDAMMESPVRMAKTSAAPRLPAPMAAGEASDLLDRSIPSEEPQGPGESGFLDLRPRARKESPEAEQDDEDVAEFGEGPPSRVLHLDGRIRLLKDGALVIEIASDGLDWELPEKVRVQWRDGRSVAAGYDLKRTTRAGFVKAGRSLTLCLQLPEDAPSDGPCLVLLRGEGKTIRITLSPR